MGACHNKRSKTYATNRGSAVAGNRKARKNNSIKINQGQQAVIDRINKKVPVGSNVPPRFGGGVLMEPIEYTLQADGTIEYRTKTMRLNSEIESATIGVGSIPPRVRIYETTGKIMRDANINNMKNSYTQLKRETLIDKALSKKEYREYQERLRKLKASD